MVNVPLAREVHPDFCDRPVVPTDRIGSLDVLRGVAVLGILVMNIQSFAMVLAAYSNPHALGRIIGIDYAVWLIGYLLFDTKFMSIFSMLFGAGILLMSERWEAKGHSAVKIHYRRMAILLMVGMIHAYLVWFGDILFHYALCGMVVYPLRRLGPGWLLTIAFALLFFAFGFSLLDYALPSYGSSENYDRALYNWQPTDEQVAYEQALLRGSWWQVFKFRVPIALFLQFIAFPFGLGQQILGLMLIGMTLMKWKVMTGERSSRFYVLMIGIGLAISLPALVWDVSWKEAAGWEMTRVKGLSGAVNHWASLPMALAWIGVVMLWFRCGWLSRVAGVFAAVGRMAFTNYLMQSVLCTFFFYGWGLGYFGYLSRVEQVVVLISVWALQLMWSPFWLKWFKYGPMEWAWRCLTYWRLQSIRR